MPKNEKRFLVRLKNRISDECQRVSEGLDVLRIKVSKPRWPCLKKQYLLVGCESSGTTAISKLLLRDGGGRFLYEGGNHWVWEACNSIYQQQSTIRDYARLQVYDRMKIPRFASILDHYVKDFPNVSVIYVLRDPRDVVVSACKTFNVTTENGLQDIPWVTESWLGIQETEPVARLAARWKRFLEKGGLVPNVRYVRYEDFCTNKVACIEELASDLGIPCNRERLMSLCDQQASPSVTRAYRPSGPGSWKNGKLRDSDLRIIEEICGPQMQAWGYL